MTDCTYLIVTKCDFQHLIILYYYLQLKICLSTNITYMSSCLSVKRHKIQNYIAHQNYYHCHHHHQKSVQKDSHDPIFFEISTQKEIIKLKNTWHIYICDFHEYSAITVYISSYFHPITKATLLIIEHYITV